MNAEQQALVMMALATTVFNQADLIRKLTAERDELLAIVTTQKMLDKIK